MKDEDKVVKLFNGVTDVGDDLIEEAGTVRKRKKITPWRGAAIAACLCLALVGTAFAASPALRDMLAEALGGFAPYAQRQDSAVYTWNGFEFEVLSALADENTVRVYTRITDLEGQGRVNINDERWLGGFPWLDVYVPNTKVAVTGGCGETNFERYDEAAQTTIAVTTIWGQITDDLTGAELWIDTAQNRMDGKTAVTIPLDVEVMSSKTIFKDIELAGVQAEELRISPLGITAILWREGYNIRKGLDAALCIRLKDDTQIKTERENVSGYGTFESSDGSSHEALIWNFTDPVELDQIAGVYIGEDYFPVD